MTNDFDYTVPEKVEDFTNTIFPKALKEALEQACLKVEADSKKNCPVEVGTLRQSITHDIEELEEGIIGYVGSNIEYAPYIHQGTGIYALEGKGRKEVPWWYYDNKLGQFVSTFGLHPHPFIQEAVEANRKAILDYFRGVLNG